MKEPVILCVDDEEFVVKSLKRELNTLVRGKYLIETAGGATEALEVFQELLQEGHPIPLVISDHIMPGIKGDELLRQIHEIAPHTLTIMLTGQADMQAVINAVNHAQLYRYISKPWEPTDLALTVKEAIRRYFQERALEQQNAALKNSNIVLEEKVKARTAELEAQQIELKQLNASKDKFFSIIAHDLRNPFTGLLGITDFIINHVAKFTPDEIKEHLGALRDAAKNVYTLIENLLTWSRLQRGLVEHYPQKLDIADIAEHVALLLKPAAALKTISLNNDIAPGVFVYADKDMLETVLRNLTSNALKFTPPHGVVALSARPRGAFTELAVADTGVGIPEDELTNLFRIDVRYTNLGTCGEEGTGLGLILCKELIEKNGGTIHVESEIGQGSIFTVSLPARPPSGA